MKKDKRNVFVCLNKDSGFVESAKCSCPAGNSGYCNHVMALLFEIANYSLNQLDQVPEEIACTSRLRQWGVPGESGAPKSPVMWTTVQKNVNKRGISTTLYSPRKIEPEEVFEQRTIKFQTSLEKINKNIGFASCIPDSTAVKSNTPYGLFDCRSPLSYHLNPVGFDFDIVTDIEKIELPLYSEEDYISLPLEIIGCDSCIVPVHWDASEEEKSYIRSITVTESIALSDIEPSNN